MGKSELELDKWELSRKMLVSILTESRYSPGEFADSLGSPSFTQLLKSVNPFAPWGIKTVFKAAVLSRVPKMNRRFAKECGLGLFAKRLVDGCVVDAVEEEDGKKHRGEIYDGLDPHAAV